MTGFDNFQPTFGAGTLGHDASMKRAATAGVFTTIVCMAFYHLRSALECLNLDLS